MFRVAAVCIILIIGVIVRSNADFKFTDDPLKESHGETIFSSVVIRHGHRTPTHQYPNDDYKEKKYWDEYWPEGEGQLSNGGKQQMYEVGQWFHERYNKQVEKGYRHDFLKEESSDVDRTIMSGQCFLAGFLPPKKEEKIADELGWQPIPVRQIPLYRDNKIATYGAHCDRYLVEKEILKEDKDEILKGYYKEHEEVFKVINENTGLEATPDDVLQGIRNAFDVYDVLLVEKSYGLTLPPWAEPEPTGIFPTKLKKVASLNFTLMVHTEKMQKIKAGVLIGQMLEEMESKKIGDPKVKETFHIYSGHDITIAGLLVSLHLKEYDGVLAPYGAAVFIELRKKDNDYFVTISYRTSDDSAPQVLHLEKCGEFCTFDEFKELTQHVVPKDWQAECAITEEERKWLDEKLKKGKPETETSD